MALVRVIKGAHPPASASQWPILGYAWHPSCPFLLNPLCIERSAHFIRMGEVYRVACFLSSGGQSCFIAPTGFAYNRTPLISFTDQLFQCLDQRSQPGCLMGDLKSNGAHLDIQGMFTDLNPPISFHPIERPIDIWNP